MNSGRCRAPRADGRIWIGLDGSESQLVAVRSSRARGGIKHASFEDLAASPADEFKQLHDSAAAHPVAASFPAHACLIRWVSTPLKSLGRARKVLPSLLDVELPFSLEECIYRFPSFRRSKQGQVEALALVARKADVAAHLAMLQAKGIDPVRLDAEGLALWSQSLSEEPAEPDEPRVVAYLGEDRHALAIGRGDELIAVYGGRTGSRDLFPPQAKDGAPAEDALRLFVRRAQHALRASETGTDRSRLLWYWTGPGAESPDQLAQLQAALNQNADRVVFDTHREAATFLARALGSRAFAGGPLDGNLRLDDFVHPAVEQRRACALERAWLSVLLAGLVLMGLAAGWRQVLRAADQAAQARLLAEVRELAPDLALPPYGQEVAAVKRAEASHASGPGAAFTRAFQPSLTHLLNDILAAAQQNGLRLQRVKVQDDAIVLRGTAMHPNACEPLAALLRERGYDIRLDREKQGEDERVAFVIQGGQTP